MKMKEKDMVVLAVTIAVMTIAGLAINCLGNIEQGDAADADPAAGYTLEAYYEGHDGQQYIHLVLDRAIFASPANLTVTGDGYLYEALALFTGTTEAYVEIEELLAGTYTATLVSTVTGEISADFYVGETYSISVVSSEGGTVTPDKVRAQVGETVTLDIDPDMNYKLKSLHMGNQAISSRTFTMPASDVVINATFGPSSYIQIKEAFFQKGTTDYTIKVILSESVTNGELSLYRENTLVKHVLFPPGLDYVRTKLGPTLEEGTYDVIVTSEYGTNTAQIVWPTSAVYNVKTIQSTGGTISADKATASAGDTVRMSVYVNDGYKFSGIYVDGTKISGMSFTMPASDVTVTSSFEEIVQSHIVSYDLNGGTGSIQSQTLRDRETFEVASCSGSKAGYVFSCWSYDGKEYQPGDTVTMHETDIQFKAVWVPEVVGEMNIASQDTYKTEDVVEFTISFSDMNMVRSMHIHLDYPARTEVVSYEWLVDAIVSDFDGTDGVLAWFGDTDANKAIFKISLKVTASDSFTLGCVATFNPGEMELTAERTISEKTYIDGDLNGDGRVTSDDSVYLLYSTFMPNKYPLNQNADFNDDGVVNSDDSVYLLYYSFMPNKYPLHPKGGFVVIYS